jgi:alpha-beta hydrolase superfamily lysophospholipase
MTKELKSYKQIDFKSLDGLKITADYYPVESSKGLILLCHRSHCNRGEYRETAPKFNKLGFSCLAIDQRSGMKVFGVTNETKLLAAEKGLPTGYIDAKPDIASAIEFCYDLNNKNPIILLGSSYSASLSLLISIETNKVKATIAISPGEYLKGINLADKIKSIDKPTFVTSPKKEIEQVTDLMRNVKPKFVEHFKPTVEGFHGSKTLWESVKGYETFWDPLARFLERVK